MSWLVSVNAAAVAIAIAFITVAGDGASFADHM